MSKLYLTDNYTAVRLCGIPYLMPYGQGVVDMLRQLRLNESAMELYSLTSQLLTAQPGLEETALVRSLLDSHPDMQAQDASDYVRSMLKMGCLSLRETSLIENPPFPLPSEKNPVDAKADKEPIYFKIGDYPIAWHGSREWLSPELFSFESKSAPTSAPLDISFCSCADNEHLTLRSYYAANTPYVGSSYLRLYKNPGSYMLYYPDAAALSSVIYDIDRCAADFYIKDSSSEAEKNELPYHIFHALRLVFSIAVQANRNAHIIHSASFIYRDRAFLVSAPSGTGKSTHVDYWRERFPDEVTDQNGDLNLLAIKNEIAMVQGLPWNGTSGIYHNRELPLGGVILLHRGERSYIRKTDTAEKALGIFQRLISPFFEETQIKRNAGFSERIASLVPVWHFFAVNDASAAVYMKAIIDRTL